MPNCEVCRIGQEVATTWEEAEESGLLAVCMTDQSVGMIFTNESTLPMVSTGTTTVTISDKTGQCPAINFKWSHFVLCNGLDDCKIKGAFP